MATTTLTRTGPTGHDLRCGTWTIDPARAVVSFSGKASFLTPTVSARFLGVAGSLAVIPEGAELAGAVDVSVDVTSMTTGNPVWDELIASVDPFDSQHAPVATYRSTRVRWAAGQACVDGSLTLRGVTRSVALSASYDIGGGGDRMLVRASGSIDRTAYGIGFDLPGCGRLVPRVMRLAIDVDVLHAA